MCKLDLQNSGCMGKTPTCYGFDVYVEIKNVRYLYTNFNFKSIISHVLPLCNFQDLYALLYAPALDDFIHIQIAVVYMTT